MYPKGSQSHILKSAILSDAVIDVGWSWCCGDGLQPTYKREGPFAGMQGAGTSRLDTFIVNQAAAAAISDFRHEWGWEMMILAERWNMCVTPLG